jgi:2,6-dihydroxypyridine 3-monooxygenase
VAPPSAAVVGGSIGGLTAALVLRDLGCEVTVFERTSGEQTATGAGIVAHPETLRYFLERGGMRVEEVSAPSRWVRYLGPGGEVVHEAPSRYRFTAWGTLHGALQRLYGAGDVRRGEAFVGLAQDAGGVDLRFASGHTARAELAVFADGILSTARRRLLRDVAPVYSGYVGWRGTVGEEDLEPDVVALLSDALTYALTPTGHIVAYPIPDIDGGLEVGSRRMNYVWYRNVPDGPALDELMTDRTGVHRPVSLGPGAVQDRFAEEVREAAGRELPPPLAQLVARTPRPFVQAVADVEVPRMAFGRACLMGDAAFGARPHAAAGTAKAAADAWALAGALAAESGDVPRALARWEPGQLALGRALLARVRTMGERSQFRHDWTPGDPDLRFGLREPGDADM